MLCADCTSTHNYAKILVVEEWCSRSLSSPDSFPPATFHSQHTLQSHTQIIESKWCISNAVGGNKKRAQACCAVLMPSHPAEPLDTHKIQLTLLETAYMEELLRVSLSIKVPICFSEEPLKAAVLIAEVQK